MSRLGNRGFSIIEILIASAMLVTAATVVSYLVIHSQRDSVSLQGMSLCQSRAQMLIQTFKNADNKASLSNFIPTTNPVPTSAVHHELGIYPLLTTSSGSYAGSSAPLTASATNGWELIDSGSVWALSLAKSNSAYCSTTNAPAGKLLGPADTASFATYNVTGGQGTLMPPASNLKNEKDYLQIEIIDNGGVAACPVPSTRRLIPIGLSNIGTPQYTVEITGTITFSDETNRTVSCNAATKLKPDGNSLPPVFIDPRSVPGALTASPNCGAPPNFMCVDSSSGHEVPAGGGNPAIACDSTSVSATFQVNEAATVFGCAVFYATNVAALPLVNASTSTTLCIDNPSLNIPGLATSSLVITPYTGQAKNGSGAKITITPTSAQDGFYRIFVKAFDAAQNSSYAYVDVGVDNTRPTVVSITPPNPLIGGFNSFPSVTRSHLPVLPPWVTGVNFGSSLFQCEESLPTDFWQVVSTTEPITVSQLGASWAYSNNGGGNIPLTGTGTCPTTIASPSGLASGSYTMYAYGCDQCGSAPSTGTMVSWNVDKNPTPMPAHAPATLPLATFNSAGLAQWNLSVPKPAPSLFQYACENADSSLRSQTATCAPTGLPALGCSAQGSKGMCTAAFDGCGRAAADVPSPYQIAVGLGQSCCNVPCKTGLNLVCDTDYTPSRGTCVAKTPCTTDANCGGAGAVCYLDTGTCHGPSVGPSAQVCTAPVPLATATPMPTPIPTPTASSCAPTSSTATYTPNLATCGPVNGDSANFSNRWNQQPTQWRTAENADYQGDVEPLVLCSGFYFNIPANATIDGVQMQESLLTQGGLNPPDSTFQSVSLAEGGALIAGSTKTLNLDIPINPGTSYTQGGSSDTWGVTLTPAMVNDPTFAVALETVRGGGRFFINYHNAFTAKIYYTAPTTSPGICGSADGVYTTTAPTTGLCADGSMPPVAGTGPVFTWSCAPGTCGGTTASCSTPAAAPCIADGAECAIAGGQITGCEAPPPPTGLDCSNCCSGHGGQRYCSVYTADTNCSDGNPCDLSSVSYNICAP